MTGDPDETITPIIAGCCFRGDGGPASAARIFGVYAAEVSACGDVYLADSLNQRIRKLAVADARVAALEALIQQVQNSTTPPPSVRNQIPPLLTTARNRLAACDIGQAMVFVHSAIDRAEQQRTLPALSNAQRAAVAELITSLIEFRDSL